MKWPICIFLGWSSLASDWANPLSPNLPIAKTDELAKPFIPAVAPVKKILPLFLLSILFADSWATKKAPKQVTLIAFCVSIGSNSTTLPFLGREEELYAYNVYQIEGEGRSLFSKIEGDENTIMGLPIKQIKEYLIKYEWISFNCRSGSRT